MPKQIHEAFSKEYAGLTSELITEVELFNPAVCNFGPPNVEFIIGMDIIKLGDFMIANSFEKTLFSFATPPLTKRIDLTKEAMKTW